MPVIMTVTAPASSEDKTWADRDAFFILQGLGVKPRNALARWFQGPRFIRVIVKTQDAGDIKLHIKVIHDKTTISSSDVTVVNIHVLDELLQAMQNISHAWLSRNIAVWRR